MEIQLKEFWNLDELNDFLLHQEETEWGFIRHREYVDIKTTWDNYNSQMRYILIYKQY